MQYLGFLFAVTAGSLSLDNVSAFTPAARSNVHPSTSLSMSSALIVQNKGGGHGELGKPPMVPELYK